MIKKILVLASVFFLMACGNEEEQANPPATTQDPATEENGNMNEDETLAESVLDQYDPLVVDTMFADAIGNQAWEDYKTISEQSTLMDMEAVGNIGDSMEAIQGKMADIVSDDIESVAQTVIEEIHEVLLYEYKAPVNDEEVAIAIISLHFSFDQLYYTAIVPGAYAINEAGVYDVVEDYNQVETLSDLVAFEPKPNVFGVSQYHTEGNTYQQVQLFAAPNAESEIESNLIDSLIFDGEEVFDELAVPFEYAEEVGYAFNGLEIFETSYAHADNRPGEEASEEELADPNYYLANGYSNVDLVNIYDRAYDNFSDTVEVTGAIRDFHYAVEEEYLQIIDKKFAELEEDIGVYMENHVAADDPEAFSNVFENAQTYLEGILFEAKAKMDVANEQVDEPNPDLTNNVLLSLQNHATGYLLDLQFKETDRFFEAYDF